MKTPARVRSSGTGVVGRDFTTELLDSCQAFVRAE